MLMTSDISNDEEEKIKCIRPDWIVIGYGLCADTNCSHDDVKDIYCWMFARTQILLSHAHRHWDIHFFVFF